MRTALALVVCIAAGAAIAEEPLDSLRVWLGESPAARDSLEIQPFAAIPLTRPQAEEARTMMWNERVARLRAEREAEWEARSISLGDKVMRFEFRVFGEKPEGGRSLFISMHGGGNAPPATNDQQWRNQVKLYKPEEGVYLAPRAPTDTWNLWHEAHIDTFFERIIEDAVVFEGVNPDRVYLTGYSAGGDGVYQLGPRMADRFAAAAMMAGHPNETSPLGLRNLPFAIHVGENDGGYKRNAVAKEWGERLDVLRKDDPGGYEHVVELHAGRGHWMEREDAKAVPWMAGHTRNPVPVRVVWKQDDVTHRSLYWLAVSEADRKAGSLVVASFKDQGIEIEKAEGVGAVTILLDDRMVNLDHPVTVAIAGGELHKGKVERTIADLARTLDARGDRLLMFPASVRVALPVVGSH
ncbi:hypothetical protein PHYC_03637 [Phycisphaerales bacterium]|nr:hypothetical protein PHYC_03637 [Phycisphaerales bacterium]